jgi:4-amino-4-deoxy-L-arabinose transferase-like glycosyltransferase
MRKLAKSTILLIAILLLGAFFRFYAITEIPPGLYPDEAMNGTNVLEALHTGNFRVFYPENNGREGLFINIQALSVWLFGNEPWALRVVSAIFGTITILALYLLTKELFFLNQPQTQNEKLKMQNDNVKLKNNPPQADTKLFPFSFFTFHLEKTELIALLSSFFLATSYWHINFSRIGFRAITVPFFAAFGMYWLLKGLRTGKISSIALSGIFIGLGFHTYIAFRFMPFIAAVPLGWYLWRYQMQKLKFKSQNYNSKVKINEYCIPCAIILFLFITFIVALPIGWYFLQNPADFFGRGGQVSIFAAEQPLYEFVKSNLITLQMFFWQGDCNPRHNFNCQPELHPIVGIFFILGIIFTIARFFKSQITNTKSQTNPNDQNNQNWNLKPWNLFGIWNLEFGILLSWLFFMSLPATLTTEGIPHALRSIGMIPAVMIFAGFGAYGSYAYLQNILAEYAKKPRFAERVKQIGRIQKEIFAAFLLLLAVIAFSAYKNYFIYFEKSRATYSAFRVDLLNMARYVNSLPEQTNVYLLANYPDTRYGIPLEAEVIKYITDTARTEEQNKKHILYLLPEELPRVRTSLDTGTRTELIPMNAREKGGVKGLLTRFPELKLEVMNDFAVLRNYQR